MSWNEGSTPSPQIFPNSVETLQCSSLFGQCCDSQVYQPPGWHEVRWITCQNGVTHDGVPWQLAPQKDLLSLLDEMIWHPQPGHMHL